MDGELIGRKVLRLPEVCQVSGLSRSTIYKKIAEGGFPAPVRLSSRAVGWRLADLDAWIESPERRWDPSEGK